LRAGGLLALELAVSQVEAVASALSVTGRFEAISVVRDLTGRDRVVTAVRKADS
jgi:methylase of polypeptide subunit release factors